MDLSRDITYRGLNINSLDTLEPSTPLSGYMVSDIRYPEVEGWGYSEKRSLDDGYDSSRVYLGQRLLLLRGSIFAVSQAELWDKMRTIRALFTPTLAYREDSTVLGYLPMDFDVPTEDTDTWATGYIPMRLYVRPKAQPGFFFPRELSFGRANGGFSIPYEVMLEARDPRFYNQSTTDVTATDATVVSASVTNDGDYHAPLNCTFGLTAAEDTGQRTLTVTGFGTVMTVKVPASANTRVVRVDGEKKVVTLTDNGVETLRMDLVTFAAGYTWPVVEPGANEYGWTTTGGAMGAGSKMWFREAFA